MDEVYFFIEEVELSGNEINSRMTALLPVGGEHIFPLFFFSFSLENLSKNDA